MNKKILIPLILNIALLSSCGTNAVNKSTSVNTTKKNQLVSDKKIETKIKLPQNTNNIGTMNISQTYKVGDSGTEVGILQQNLNKFGYKLTIDNNFGINTKNAIIDFQIRNDINSDGVCGPQTIEKLKLSPTSKTTFDGKFKIPGQLELEKFINTKESSSATPYYIWVDSNNYTVNIFSGSNHNWNLIKSMDCAMGTSDTPTIKGTFLSGDKGSFFETNNGLICKYYTRIDGGYLFHSVLYDKNNNIVDGRLAEKISHGCIRLELDNAKWIYDTIPEGSTIYIK